MTRRAAALGSALFFAVAPGTIGGLVPWALTGWHAGHGFWPGSRILGCLLILGGGLVLVGAFAEFALRGLGTPAPVAPPQQLVVQGPYRYVRNPIFLALLAVIVGQALLLGRAGLLAYALVVGAALASQVLAYEEPTLSEQFGAEYEAYRQAVPRWLPRRRAWVR